MSEWPLLSIVTFLPLVGALWILVIPGDSASATRNARWVALHSSMVTFAISLFLWFGFDRTTAEFQFVERAEWMPDFGIAYHMGVD
ncbi:MAG: NADH-quinone oxidoreductase subunit M, partial [Dongiaceae bacterium]